MENTQNIMIKRLAALLVAVFVVVMVAVPSFAYTDNSVNSIDFSEQPITKWNQSPAKVYYNANSSNIFTLAQVETDPGSNRYYRWGAWSLQEDIYAFAYLNGSTNYITFCSQVQNAQGCFNYWAGADYAYAYTSLNCVSQNSTTGLYYTNVGITSDYGQVVYGGIEIPQFSSRQEGLDAVLDWINNPPVSSQPLSLSLQPGNVAYIDITNTNATITLTQHTSVAYWQLTSTQYIGASNSLPSSGFTVPIAGTGMIDWIGVGRKTVQGQYNDWTSVNQISGSASDHQHVYAIVVNPLQNNVTTGSGLDVSSVANGIINISVDPAWSVKIYQLENQFSLGVDSNTQSGDTGTGTYDTDTGQWNYTNDQTGESFEQQYGGMTTPESQFDSIHDFLENIANTISGFFSGAINAVSTLVGAGSSFFGVLGGLYSWLPPAVYSVLVSALIIVITIGVIKVFV